MGGTPGGRGLPPVRNGGKEPGGKGKGGRDDKEPPGSEDSLARSAALAAKFSDKGRLGRGLGSSPAASRRCSIISLRLCSAS